MRYFFLLIILLSFNSYSDEKVRPGPHNKMGHTKQSAEQKKMGSSINSLMMNLIFLVHLINLIMIKYYHKLRN